MKTTLIIFITTVLFLPNLISKQDVNVSQQDVEKAILIFDGYEGGYYFFTDKNCKAVSVIAKDETPLHNLDLINDDYVGEQFEVTIDTKDGITPIIPVQNIKYIIASNTP